MRGKLLARHLQEANRYDLPVRDDCTLLGYERWINAHVHHYHLILSQAPCVLCQHSSSGYCEVTVKLWPPPWHTKAKHVPTV